MEIFMKAGKNIAARSLMAVYSEYSGEHRFEPQNGKIYNSFGYIESGTVVMKSVFESLTAGSGDLIFIPEGAKYCSIWSATDKIAFYSIHFRSDLASDPFWSTFGMQKITGMSGDGCGERVKRIFSLCGSGSPADQLRGYREFYGLASDAAEKMRKSIYREVPDILAKALDYINENYRTIGSVAEIAQSCYVSESRLYHLFRDHLQTTPVTCLNRIWILQATEMMKESSFSLEQIAAEMNFNSEYCFRKTFIRVTGITPSEFRKKRKI